MFGNVYVYLLDYLVVSISLQIFTQRNGEDEPVLTNMFIDTWIQMVWFKYITYRKSYTPEN